MKKVLLLLALLSIQQAFGQFRLPQAKLSDEKSHTFLLVNATVVPSPGQKMEAASIYVKDGKIAAIGKDLKVPAGTYRRDAKGAWVYPSFIDLFSTYGMAAASAGKQERTYPMSPQYESNRPGTFLWNQALKPELDASTLFQVNAKEAEEL